MELKHITNIPILFFDLQHIDLNTQTKNPAPFRMQGVIREIKIIN